MFVNTCPDVLALGFSIMIYKIKAAKVYHSRFFIFFITTIHLKGQQ